MKVIFLQDVSNLARVGEVKEVADGYGRNFLIPRKLALPARSGVMNTVEAQIAKEVRSQAQSEAELIEMAAQLEGREVFLEARAGGTERLYGSVTNSNYTTPGFS